MTTLEEKVVALESRLRRQRFGMIGMGLGLAAALFLGMTQQTPRELTLDNLTLTDGLMILKDDKPRVFIGTNEENGDVGIGVLDLQGKARVALGTDAKGDGGVAVMDKNEAPRILMGTGPDGAGIMLIGAGLTEIPMPAPPAKE